MAPKSVAKVGAVTNSTRVTVKYKKPNKTNTKYPMQRLPFFNWDMPKAHGYGPGCEMGKAAAKAFMKALRASKEGYLGGNLQHLVLGMLKAGTDPENAGDSGIVVGFFSYLDQWLFESAQIFGSSLDKITEQEIEKAMTLAANETEEEHTKRMETWLSERRAA